MQSTANWVSNSQVSPVITKIFTDNFDDDWISNSQSNPQIAAFSTAIASANSTATANAGSTASSLANSQGTAVGSATYSFGKGTASANSIANGNGSFILNSIIFYSLDYWVTNSNLSPAFIEASSTYFDHWISKTQSSPQTAKFYVIQVNDTLFFGMI